MRSHAGIFQKLNLKDQQEILVLHAPESFMPELARLPILTIHHYIESVVQISFLLAFVMRKSEVETLAGAVAERATGDATVWFAYPKGTSKKFKCDFNRDTGWNALNAAGFDYVRAVAIDRIGPGCASGAGVHQDSLEKANLLNAPPRQRSGLLMTNSAPPQTAPATLPPPCLQRRS